MNFNMKGFTVLFLVVFAAAAQSAHVRGVSTKQRNVVGVDECPVEQETNWEIEWLMRHEDCNKFYKCAFGKPVEYRCYGDLYFNLATWQCDWQHNVDCEGRNVPDATTTLAPTTTSTTTTTTTPAPTTTTSTTTTTTPAPTTTTSTTTTTTPAPTTTTSTTTTTTPAPTTTTSTTTTTTPAPTTVDEQSTTVSAVPPIIDLNPTTPSTTTTTTTTTAAPTTTTSTTTTTTPTPTTTSSTTTQSTDSDIEFQENGCPVNPHIHWLLPHEYDCNLFYYCVWGEKVLRQCPANLHFNTRIQVCDWPVDAGCTLSGSPSSFAALTKWFKHST